MDKIKFKLIVGLGNPGDEYTNTRHNTGFLCVDKIVKKLETTNFQYEKKLLSEIAKNKIIFAKPQTIIKALKTKNFWRLRIGIQPIRQAHGKPKHIPADKIILKKFTSAELKTLDKTIKKAAEGIL